MEAHLIRQMTPSPRQSRSAETRSAEQLMSALRQLEAAGVQLSEVIALEDQIKDARAARQLSRREFFVCRRGIRNLAIYVQVEELDGRAYVTGYRLEGCPRMFGTFCEAEAEAENAQIPVEIVTPGRRTLEIGCPHRDEQHGVKL